MREKRAQDRKMVWGAGDDISTLSSQDLLELLTIVRAELGRSMVRFKPSIADILLKMILTVFSGIVILSSFEFRCR